VAKGDGPAWLPGPGQAALLVALCELVATEDPTAWELLEHGAARLAALLECTCIASLLSDDGRWLHPLGVADPDPEVSAALESFGGARLRADRGFARQVLAAGRTLRLTDPAPEVLAVGRPELSPYVERFGVGSVVVAPMRVRGRPTGHVAVLRRAGRDPLTDRDERFVQVVADALALGVQSAGWRDGALTPTDLGVEPPDLSERERGVLGLLALGHTNREIAERLVLSIRTVEWHRARIQFKLGVTGRAALARQARALGLIEGASAQ
jgi:DNA-binding CsgD family transcriptional regulator